MSQVKEVESSKESEVTICGTQKKKKNIALANICHKNSSGTNNWKKFLELDTIENGSKPKKSKNNVTNTRPKPLSSVSNKEISNSESVLTQNNKKNHDNLRKVKTKSEVDQQLIDKLTLSTMKGKCVLNEKSLTKQIAMDCEMVGVEVGVNKNMLARVSLVNALGDCIYDKYVKPTEPVLDYRTHVSGIRPNDLENASDFKTVQADVADILKGRVLVGHSLKHDLSVLFLTHPRNSMRDTSKYQKFREGRTPSLKKLAEKYLGVKIQEGEHSSVQDALAAMQLYRMFRKDWEASVSYKSHKKQKNQEASVSYKNHKKQKNSKCKPTEEKNLFL